MILGCCSPLMSRSALRFMECLTSSRSNTPLGVLLRNSSVHFNPFGPFSFNLFYDRRKIWNILSSTQSRMISLSAYIFRFKPFIAREFSMCNSTLLSNSNTICSSILFFR